MTTPGKLPSSRRNELARERGFKSYAEQRKTKRGIANRADLASLPAAAQQARSDALDVIALARRNGINLAAASAHLGVPSAAVTFWGADAIADRRNGGHVTAADRMFRPMYVYSVGQATAVDVRGSRTASVIGRYHSAIGHYLKTGDESRLSRFNGQTVGGVELETDADVIDDLARRGRFDFESIYRMVS
jgi:hypothetical protein